MKNNNQVLIVDDDRNIRTLVRINLEPEGFPVQEAVNGREAIRMMRRSKPALILLDVMMPEMDGWETAKRINDDPDLSGIPVIMLTAKTGEKDKMIGKDIFKADEYITKPFDIEELIVLVKKKLGS